ncbi:minichromosome maintenance domain-containing protein 2 isoform X2 [Hyla sarda]|uniref:minichromosome maintenance domain-containing protein 2 isoform X2 n=1 Tax=Hyla sarda TaxID=327740 RepID=UPI0024C417F2|nr:minichromosome maintenance domain-containing protein 2 isoform X2 [Hyla sarda]
MNPESGQSYAVYRFVISVNPMDITELNATLGNYILHEPVRAAAIFQSVCDAAVRTISLIEEYQSEAQINVILKVTHLPDLPGYHLSLREFPLDYRSQRLYMMEGTVIALSTVNKYTQGARFLCSETKCPLSTDFRYIRIHTPGATESATVRQEFFCDLCASPLKEDIKYRVLGDKQVVEFMDSKTLKMFQGQCTAFKNYRLQSYAVFLRDELIDRMKIGGRYRVIGIPVCGLNGSQLTVCIEANNIHQYIAHSPLTICKVFQKLHSKTQGSPWIFTGILANIFAAQVVPVGMHNTLKLCILLSLVQTCNEDKEIGNPLDLMVVTNDTLIVERLMRYSICLVPRGVCHTHFNDVLATVTKDELGTGTAIIHAGSALMAKGGVCFIGDINSHKKEKLDLLLSVLENRNTTVFIPGKKYGDGVDQQIYIPVQCNFWSYADLSNYSKKCTTKEPTFIGQMDLSAIPSHLIDAFGALINCNQISHTSPVVSLVQHSLIKAIRPGAFLCLTAQRFTTQDFEELIGYAKNLHVTFSTEAEALLHSYYLASRRVRTDSNGSKVLTSALRHLTSVAEAHAKLSLRRVVTEEDALVAILLFEASLTLKHGSSVFGVCQNPLFPSEIIDEDSLQQRDEYLRKYQQELRQFIFTYGPASVILTEQ